MYGLVKLVAMGCQGMGARQDNTVGQFRVVQDSPTTGQSPHRGARQTGQMSLAIGERLKVP